MNKPSSKTSKLVVTLLLPFFILSAFVVSGFGGGEEGDGGNGGAQAAAEVDVIRNGGFEERDSDSLNGVALEWEPFTNGQAFFGFYDDTWPEAIRSGEHAQLMEIFEVEANVLDRIIAIHQTVDVAPNADYALTIHAILRTQAPAIDRNKSEFEMHWGVDFLGEGNIENVEKWNLMPLTEQFRLGSSGKYPEDIPLFYETITGTVHTGDSNRITLFIRGLKKFPTGTEVNFDIDDVSLIGPSPAAPQDPSSPEAPATTPGEQGESNLPPTGASLPKNVSAGSLVLGGLIVVLLSAGAAAGLLKERKG